MQQQASDAEGLIYLGKAAQQAGRWADSFYFTDLAIKTNPALCLREKWNLFCGYKNFVTQRRSSLRSLRYLQTQVKNEEQRKILAALLQSIRLQILQSSQKVIKLVDQFLLPNLEDPQASLHFLKIKSDSYRYLCEFVDGEALKEAQEKSNLALQQIQNIYKQVLIKSPTPTILGMRLSQAVYAYEIFNDKKKALLIAKTTFDAALGKIQQLEQKDYKDCTCIMALLKKNIDEWEKEETDQNN